MTSKGLAWACVLIGTLLMILGLASCTPPAPDYTYCQDLQDSRIALQQYADIDRPSVESELLDDINEMGIQARCNGYSYAQEDD